MPAATPSSAKRMRPVARKPTITCAPRERPQTVLDVPLEVAQTAVSYLKKRTDFEAAFLVNKIWSQAVVLHLASYRPKRAIVTDAIVSSNEADRCFRARDLCVQYLPSLSDTVANAMNFEMDCGWVPEKLSLAGCGESTCSAVVRGVWARRAPYPAALELKDCKTNGDTIRLIVKTMREGMASKLTHLCLSGLGDRFEIASPLRRLNCSSFTGDSLVGLVTAFVWSPPLQLEHLDLSNNAIGANGVESMATRLRQGALRLPKLAHLNIRSNHVSDAAYDLIDVVVAGKLPRIGELDLLDNQVPRLTHTAILSLLTSGGGERLPLSLRRLSIDGDVDFLHYAIFGKGALKALEGLTLSGSQRDCTTMTSSPGPRHPYFRGLGGLEPLGTLVHFHSRGLPSTWAVRDLALERCAVDDEGATLLARAIAASLLPNLHLLNLCFNRFTWKGARAVILSPRRRPGSEMELRMSHNTYLFMAEHDPEPPPFDPPTSLIGPTELHLAGCMIGPRGLDTALRDLHRATALEALNLSRNRLGAEGGTALARELGAEGAYPSLVSLNVFDCKLSLAGISSIVAKAGDGAFRRIKWLTLTDNCADDIGASPVLNLPMGAFCRLCTLHVDTTLAEHGLPDALASGGFPSLTDITAWGQTSTPDRADAIREACRARKIEYIAF